MERHEKAVLFEPSTNQFGHVTRGYLITYSTLKIGCKGSQWVVCIGTVVNVYGYNRSPCVQMSSTLSINPYRNTRRFIVYV